MAPRLLMRVAHMVTMVRGATLVGVDARQVEVETELSLGLPFFSIIGLGDAAVQEARYRIQCALRSTGLELPHKKITINLAPAALRKDGSALDLPMALGLLAAAELLPPGALDDAIVAGELALSGALRPVRGALSVAALARERNVSTVIVPRANGPEAAAIGGIRVVAAETLEELIAHFTTNAEIPPPKLPDPPRARSDLDLKDVRGQELARRALEIAAAGAHNLLLVGNPGTGKTMLARRLPTILPDLTTQERIDVTKVWSAAGLTLGHEGLVATRPFRAPHHTISEAGLIGGGSCVRPGEVSLAHRGVLFLDEMPELPRRVLESLRQPLEDREVVIARARQTVRLPASFMLVGAANPCPCGWLGHHSGKCVCGPEAVQRYVSRISGALLDRIDMVVEAPSLAVSELMSEADGETSAQVRTRVMRSRKHALDRCGVTNSELTHGALRRYAAATPTASKLLETSIERLQLSGRSFERTLRVARTIADLGGEPAVCETHIAEALRYRRPAAWSTPAI